MRAIDPRQYSKVQKRSSNRYKYYVIALVLTIFLASFYFLFFNKKNEENISTNINEEAKIEVINEENDTLTEDINSNVDIEFSGNELRLLYDNLLLDNTKKINEPPTITGNDIADARIRQIAESRGYKIRVEANDPLPIVFGYRLQESLREPWAQLQQAAKQEGINMSIVSGYRTIDEQRELFVSRLVTRGVNIDQVAAGLADEQINTVLIESSIPGYSKHHSGYTIDLLCSGFSFDNFKNSTCNTWLTADNYANARQFGFIPSYPEDADLQGPDPEAWEYVYVGVDALNPS